MKVLQLRKALMVWYADHRRELPWRESRDPYRVWVSEIILQQTRIVQGWSYFLRFMEEFPSVEVLAEADADRVMKAWEGLGYYTRARNLHRAAKQIVEMGRFPDTVEAVKALPGVGDYTAAAVCSIAFGLPVAAVDGNVTRVVSRLFGIRAAIDASEGKKRVTSQAELLLDCEHPADWNQAMMDFGALQCVPQHPDCGNCPLHALCQAWQEDAVEDIPMKSKQTKVRERYFAFFFVKWGERRLIHKRSARDIWRGLYEPLLVETEYGGNEALASPVVSRLMGEEGAKLHEVKRGIKHVLTHQIIHADMYVIEISAQVSLPPGSVPEDCFWIVRKDVSRYAFPKIEGMVETMQL